MTQVTSQRSNALIIDFETLDRGLHRKIDLGPAWPIKVNNPDSNMFKAIGVSLLWIRDNKLGEPVYLDLIHGTTERLAKEVAEADCVVMHNAQYDLGCLMTLGIQVKDLVVYDTKILGKLYDNNLMNYTLDGLSERYLGDKKAKLSLVDVVRKHNLGGIKQHLKTYDRLATVWAYENMDVIQDLDFEAMADYANQDTVLTGKLFLFFMQSLPVDVARKFCRIVKVCAEIRAKGVRIDMRRLREGRARLAPQIETLHTEIRNELGIVPGHEFNLDAPAQLGKQLNSLGIVLPTTPTGAFSTDKATMKELSKAHPIVAKILKYRELKKILNDYFIKIEDMQQWTCPEAYQGGPYGRVYPELNPLAAVTGRFSSCNPNIQQIPARNEEWTDVVRGIYVPEEGKTWLSLDFSNQEGRLQVHYASLINAPGIDKLVEAFHKNPNLDMHRQVANLCGLSCPLQCAKDDCKECKRGRTYAKAINLGLSYGMGGAKLCRQLGLPTKWEKGKIYGKKQQMVEVAGDEAQAIIDKYNKLMPYLTHLALKCKEQMISKGGIRTLGGRIVRREYENGVGCFDYKAINKLIQGSAADQCVEAMLQCYDAGLDILFAVHDELNLQGTIEDGLRAKEIMEKGIDFRIPFVSELETGDSWGTIK